MNVRRCLNRHHSSKVHMLRLLLDKAIDTHPADRNAAVASATAIAAQATLSSHETARLVSRLLAFYQY